MNTIILQQSLKKIEKKYSPALAELLQAFLMIEDEDRCDLMKALEMVQKIDENDSGNFLDQTHGVFQIYPKYQINYRIKKIKN